MNKGNVFRIDLPKEPQAIMFVNGLIARNLRGQLYMFRSIPTFSSSLKNAEGCIDFKSGICGPREVVMVSYWESEDALKQYFRGEDHRAMMKHYYHHADDIELYNETYRPSIAGKYNAQHGMAKIYPSMPA
ncbi:MAG: DUF4188 domain-containing protein [Chloroflexota bacterium]